MSGRREDPCRGEMMLTYSWLMTFVVFSKSHKADSKGLETGTDGWSKLDGRMDKRRVFNQRYSRQVTECQTLETLKMKRWFVHNKCHQRWVETILKQILAHTVWANSLQTWLQTPQNQKEKCDKHSKYPFSSPNLWALVKRVFSDYEYFTNNQNN